MSVMVFHWGEVRVGTYYVIIQQGQLGQVISEGIPLQIQEDDLLAELRQHLEGGTTVDVFADHCETVLLVFGYCAQAEVYRTNVDLGAGVQN